MPKLSVIIPVYNAEKYLTRCLDSIFHQEFKDIEVICVDDNSTDNSMHILKEYQQKHNIIIRKNANKGAGSSRNIGMDCANGDYLYFLDSDDFLAENSLEKMYSKITEKDADILIFNYSEYNVSDNTYKDSNIRIPDKIHDKIFCAEDIPENILSDFTNFVWNKLFKKDFIKNNNIRFQEIMRTNDVLFVRSAMLLANNIYYFNNNLINYSTGQTTNIQNNNYKMPTEFTKSILALQDFLIQNNLYSTYKESFKLLVTEEINNALMSLKSHPAQYYELAKYLNQTILKNLDLKKSDTKMWSYMKIFFVWLFSIRSYRGTGYKILNIFGHQIWIKHKRIRNK